MPKLTKRQETIIAAIVALGKGATQKAIAERTGLHPNGISQSLHAASMRDVIRCASGHWNSRAVWEIIPRAEKKHPEVQLGLFGKEKK